jgi:hypothetical protein
LRNRCCTSIQCGRARYSRCCGLGKAPCRPSRNRRSPLSAPGLDANGRWHPGRAPRLRERCACDSSCHVQEKFADADLHDSGSLLLILPLPELNGGHRKWRICGQSFPDRHAMCLRQLQPRRAPPETALSKQPDENMLSALKKMPRMEADTTKGYKTWWKQAAEPKRAQQPGRKGQKCTPAMKDSSATPH